ncbi:hypothetical protein LMG31506_02969 [Cupriavidus yeoncheonensis]|uniref:Uncharacterized protein n=1 Tax=Cupriavidus yeoncheonensis TaxID=1462994 RepID=A0A916NE17_9BURK|nr:hypothetical protein LMG31506_02969 [Cupriavidus yeoncheonensis]
MRCLAPADGQCADPPAPGLSIVAAISASTSTAVTTAISPTVISAVAATTTTSVFATLSAAVRAAILRSLIAAIPPTLLTAVFALISTTVPAAVVTVVPIAAPAALLVPVPATIPVIVPFMVTAVVSATAPIRVTATVVWARVSAVVVAVIVGGDSAAGEKCCRGYGEHEMGFHGDLRLQLANLPQEYRRVPLPVVRNRVPLREVAACRDQFPFRQRHQPRPRGCGDARHEPSAD